MSKDVAKRSKEVHNITRVISVDDTDSELNVKVDFNGKNGSFKVSTAITTKQVSVINEDVNDAVLRQVSEMLKCGISLAMKQREELQQSPEMNQISLDF